MPNSIPIPTPRPLLETLEAYMPGEQLQGAGIIKLNTNEFSYPAAPRVLDALRSAASDLVCRYPDPTSSKLRERLAAKHGVTAEGIIIGNGSDEILRLLTQAYVEPGRRVAVVQPSYTLYEVLAAQYGVQADVYPLTNGERLPEALYRAAWDVCFLPVPNPPLGTVFPDADLRRLAKHGGLVVLDGAYVDFAPQYDAAPLAEEFSNVVLTRTFSKSYGLAGMRVGYAIGHPALIALLDKLRDSYNMNRASQAAALGALDGEAYYKMCCREIIASRERMTAELTARAFGVHESHGNFVFARRADAPALYEALRARRVLVRYFQHPDLADGLRITIGTPEENAALLAALDAIFAEKSV